MRIAIVVADDDLQYHALIHHTLLPASDTLTIVGYAEDGDAALALVRRERPDLLITDLTMPRWCPV